jgi:hypothetical protein
MDMSESSVAADRGHVSIRDGKANLGDVWLAAIPHHATVMAVTV